MNKLVPATILSGLALTAIMVKAEHTVTIDHGSYTTTHTCTNTCDISFRDDDSIYIEDCCGGRVTSYYM